MAEVRTVQRTTASSSFIPVPIMARPAQSSLPSSLSLPQLSLQQPQLRSSFTSNNVLPQSSPASTSVQTSTPISGKSTFRSLRNLLPFGSGKPQSPNTSTTPKNRTLSLGRPSFTERRSITDRKVTEPLWKPSLEYTPVVVIEPPPSKPTGRDPPLNQEPLPLRSQSQSALKDDGETLSLSSSPGPPLGDLSTIVESETSGTSITKHIPLLDDSIDEDVKEYDPNLLSPQTGESPPQTPDSRNASAFDLSTSHLAEEVRDAMSEGDRKGNWLRGVVIDDLSNAREKPEGNGLVHDVSFNLSALDPELAALLSPNRMTGPEPAVFLAIKSIPSPLQTNDEKQIGPSSTNSSTNRLQMSPRTPQDWSPARPSYEFASRDSRQASPLPSKAPLASSTSSRSPSSMPRFPRPWKSDRTLTRPNSTDPNPVEAPPSSTGNISPHRPQLTVSAVDEYGRLNRHNTGESLPRRSLSSRLGTPASTSTVHHPPSSRPPLRHLVSSSAPWDADIVSPSSRASSSLGAAASRRQFGSRPSMDSEARSSMDHGRTSPLRSRSMSDSRPSPGSASSYRSASATVIRQPGSVPGPRTTRLFKAVGLMPNDDDTTIEYNYGRHSSDRDFRQMAPSRSGYSETSSSWGRNRTGTISESASVRGSTPFSVSTAPTTVSASSLQNHDSEIQILKDKHQMEMDALLSALYDSQNMHKILREENAGLRDRIQDLEDQNLDLLDQLRRPPSAPMNRFSSHDRVSRVDPIDALYKRNRPSRLQPLFTSSEAVGKHRSSSSLHDRDVVSLDPNSFLDGSIGKRSTRRRPSIASSVFQAPPSNMSMLNDDDDGGPQTSGFSTESTPPSPTLVFSNKQQNPDVHVNGQPIPSSLGNISPTTENFSSLQDSPDSLRLLSDHEDHLGDMASLDLRADFDDES